MLRKTRPLSGVIILTCILLMSLPACGTRSSAYPDDSARRAPSYPSASETPDLASGFGIVEAIDMVASSSSGGTGTGAAVGAGVAAGALAGAASEIRHRTLSGNMYRISLRMDNGLVQTLLQETAPVLRIGDRVRISNGIIERM